MKGRSLNSKRVLITCGPTWVAIDDVRVISNISSGKLGQTLANNLSQLGAKVTLLEGAVEEKLKNKKVNVRSFLYFEELRQLIDSELKKPFDIFIHAAAISDYRVQSKRGKLSSHFKKLNLNLTPTPKIINSIKKKRPNIFLVGFKLEPSLSKARNKAEHLFQKAKCDLVVANSLNKGKYEAFIVNKDKKIAGRANSREKLAKGLINAIKSNL